MTERVEISKRLVLLNTGSSILARAINLSVILWLYQYLLRRISPDEYQFLPLLTSIIFLLPLFTSILTSGLGRFVMAAYAKGDDRGVTQIASTMLPLLWAAAGLILAGGLLLAWYVDKILAVPPAFLWDARMMMALLVFSAALKPPGALFGVAFFVKQKFVLSSAINVCSELLRVFLLLVLLFGVSTRVLWVVVANVAAEVAATVLMLTLSRRMMPALRFCSREIRWERAREIMSFNGWSSVGYMAYRMKEFLVLLLLNRLATPMDLAVFHVGHLGRRQINLWTDIMAGPLYPVVTGMYAMGARDRVRNIYLRGGRLALWITLVVALPAAIYAEPIIRLYVGPAYLQAAAVMILSLAGLPLAGGVWMIWQVAAATGRVRGTSLCVLLMEVAVMALAFYAVQILRWGAIGVALSSLAVGLLVEVFVLWPLGLKLAGATFQAWARQTLLPGLTPGGVAAVVWAALGMVVQPSSWTALGLCTLAGVLCYLVVLLGVCLEPQDKEDFKTLAVRIRGFLHRRQTSGAAAGQLPSE
jgi:O-antigen/teichoic acid export membrane protein